MLTTIFGQKTWLFKPKDYPTTVWAMDMEKKIGHRVEESVLKRLGIVSETIKGIPLKLGEIAVAKKEMPGFTFWPKIAKPVYLKTGVTWNIRWCSGKEKEFGPIKPEIPKLPQLEKITGLLDATKFQERSTNVRELQDLLKKEGYFPQTVDSTGYYGSITQRAVEEFRTSQRISPPKIKTLEPSLKKQIGFFIKKISPEEKSEDVRTLQRLLKETGYFPKEIPETGYYGSITKKAIDKYEKIFPPKITREEAQKLTIPAIQDISLMITEFGKSTQAVSKKVLDSLKTVVYNKDKSKAIIQTSNPAGQKYQIEIGLPVSLKEKEEKIKGYVEAMKKVAKKDYEITPDYQMSKILDAQNRADVIRQRIKENLGIEISLETGDVKYPLNLEEAIDQIYKVSSQTEVLNSNFLKKTSELDKLIKVYQPGTASAKKLQDEIKKLDFLIDAEERKHVKDEEKLKLLYGERQTKYDIYEDARPKLIAQWDKIEKLSADTDKIRKELEKNLVTLKGGTKEEPTSWAVLFAIQDEFKSELSKLDLWAKVENKAWYDLYATGAIDEVAAGKQLGLSAEEFRKSASPDIMDKRIKALRRVIDRGTEQLINQQKVWSRIKAKVSEAIKRDIQNIGKVFDFANLILDFNRGVRAELLEIFRYNAEYREIIKTFPKGEDWVKLDERTQADLLSILGTLASENEELLDPKRHASLKTWLKDTVERGKRGELGRIYRKEFSKETQPWPIRKLATPLSWVFDLGIGMVLDPVIYLQDIPVKFFGRINKTLGPKLWTFDALQRSKKGMTQLQLFRDEITGAQIIGKSLGSVLGRTWTKTFAKGCPTFNQYLKSAFRRTWVKQLPAKIKYMFGKQASDTATDVQKAYIRQTETLKDLTSKEIERIKYILVHIDDYPKTFREMEICNILIPKTYTDNLLDIYKVNPSLGKKLGAISRKMTTRLRGDWDEVVKGMREIAPYRHEQDIVVGLLIREGVPEIREKFIKGLIKRYGQKKVSVFITAEIRARAYANAMYKLGSQAGRMEKVPWAVVRKPTRRVVDMTLSEAEWTLYRMPSGASGTARDITGKWFHRNPKVWAAQFPGVPLPKAQQKFSALFLRKKYIPTLDDRMATTIHETAHAWIKDLYMIDDIQSAGLPIVSRLHGLNIAGLKNVKRKRIMELLKKLYPKVPDSQLIDEYYAYAVEFNSMLDANRPLWLKRLEVSLRGLGTAEKREMKRLMMDLYKSGQLLTIAEKELLYSGKILPQRLIALKKVGASTKELKETLRAWEGGLDFISKEFPFEAPYRKAYWPVIKEIEKGTTRDLTSVTASFYLPRVKGGKAMPLIEGMMSMLEKRVTYFTVDDIARELGKRAIKSSDEITKFIDNSIRRGFPREDPLLIEMIKKGDDWAKYLKRGQQKQIRREGFSLYVKQLKKDLDVEYLTSWQREALENFIKELETGIKPSMKAVTDIRKYFGLHPTVIGPEALDAFDILINGQSRKFLPNSLKILLSGAWKEGHPTMAKIMMRVFDTMRAPQQLWRWFVLFGRPGWFSRNYADDLLRNIVEPDRNWEMIGKMANPKNWGENKYIWNKAIEKAPEAAGLKMTGFFFQERPTWLSSPSSNFGIRTMSKSGASKTIQEQTFGVFAKLKAWPELLAEASEVARRQGLFIMKLNKYASKAASESLEIIYKKQGGLKALILDLRKMLKPDDIRIPKLTSLAYKSVTKKGMTKVEKAWLLKEASKMKKFRNINKAFKDVERIMFDYSDLTAVERGIRYIFPFYGFWSKSFIFWSKTIAKDPRKLRAYNIYLNSIEEQTKDLPDHYKRRIKIAKHFYTLPIFSFHDTFDLWRDPVKHIKTWIKNPSHPLPGLGYDPVIGTWIEQYFGKAYWDDSNKFEYEGWPKRIKDLLGEEFVDWEKNKNFWEIYANQFPIWNVVKELYAVNNETVFYQDQILTNKKVDALSKFLFGFSIRNITDMDLAWSEYWKLPSGQRKEFLNTLPKDQQDALNRLIYINWANKMLRYRNQKEGINFLGIKVKKGIIDPNYERYLNEWPIIQQYFDLHDRISPEAANRFLAKTPEARRVMDEFFERLAYTPERAAREDNYFAGQTLAAFNLLKSDLKKRLKTEAAQAVKREYEYYGLGYPQDYTIEDFEKDVLDEKGNLRFFTLAEMEAAIPALKDKVWLKEAWDKVKDQVTNFDAEWYREREKFKITKEKDYIYSITMRTFGNLFIPEDVPATEEQYGQASENAYRFLFEEAPDWVRAESARRYPVKTEYREKHFEYLKHMWWMTQSPNLEDWYENFYDSKVTPETFRGVFFARHPEAKIYYPFAYKHSLLSKKDTLNRDKYGLFTSEASDYLKTIPGSVQNVWKKAKPEFWESVKFWETYHDLTEKGEFKKAINYWWNPVNTKVRDRYLQKIEHLKEYPFWKLRKEYWNMPRDSWEERHSVNLWLREHEDYTKWSHRWDVTEEQKDRSKVRDRLHELGAKEKATGEGREFLLSEAEIAAEKRMLYEQNDWLKEDFLRTLSESAKKEYLIQQGFFEIDPFDLEAKQAYLEDHPELKAIWRKMAAPWERRFLDLQEAYFELKTSEEKSKFLKDHPELQDYWEIKSLPWSYWFDRPRFLVNETRVKEGKQLLDKISRERKTFTFSAEVQKALIERKDEDQRWIAGQIYQYAMKKWVQLGQEDRTSGWEFFENLPNIIKDIYFKKYPEMKAYFAFCERWHNKLELDPQEGMRFFKSEMNRKWREMYFERHPKSRKFFPLLEQVNAMPKDSWEAKQKIKAWWKRNVELRDWLISKEDEAAKKLREIRETYFAILDRIPLTGSGLEYWKEVVRCRLEAQRYLDSQPELMQWLKEYAKIDSKIVDIQNQYFAIEDDEKRHLFLKEHPELKDYWYKMSYPRKREMLDLQEAYFKIPQNDYSAKEKYLKKNPELAEYWEAMHLPIEYFFEPGKFKLMKRRVDSLNDYFKTLVLDTGQGEKKFDAFSFELKDAYRNAKLSDWEKREIYLNAMNNWHKIIQVNMLRGTYYFKNLPLWIRNRYFLAHPEKQYLFRIPLDDFITEPLKHWEAEHPKEAWAYRILYQYKKFKFVPSELQEKVRTIMVSAGVWEERKDWTRLDWAKYWKEKTEKSHELRKKDIERMPKLEEFIEVLAKQYPLRPRPKPIFRKKVRIGWTVPLL